MIGDTCCELRARATRSIMNQAGASFGSDSTAVHRDGSLFRENSAGKLGLQWHHADGPREGLVGLFGLNRTDRGGG